MLAEKISGPTNQTPADDGAMMSKPRYCGWMVPASRVNMCQSPQILCTYSSQMLIWDRCRDRDMLTQGKLLYSTEYGVAWIRSRQGTKPPGNEAAKPLHIEHITVDGRSWILSSSNVECTTRINLRTVANHSNLSTIISQSRFARRILALPS